MNKKLLEKLNIDQNQGLKEILEALNQKQFEYLEREQSTADEGRRKEIEQILEEIENEITAVKTEIQNARSGLIFDDENQSAVKPSKISAETEIDAKVQALKQREEQKKTSPPTAVQPSASSVQNASPTPKTASVQNAVPVQQVQNSTVSTPSPKQQAIRAYHTKDYKTAMKLFSQLAENDDAEAQFLVSKMYYDGLGCAKEWGAFEYWSKRASDNGSKEAAEFRADVFLTKGDETGSLTSKQALQQYTEALELLENAGSATNLPPLQTYVEVVEIQYDKSMSEHSVAVRSCIKPKHIKKAIQFCQIISDNTTDSYRKKQWLDRQTALKKGKPYVDRSSVSNANANQPYSQTSAQKSNSTGCLGCIGRLVVIYVGVLVIAFIGIVISDSSIMKELRYIANHSSSVTTNNSSSVTIPAPTEPPFGSQKIELHQMPENYILGMDKITISSDNGYVAADRVWDGAFVYRAGNGGDVAYADYQLDGLFSKLEFQATPWLGNECFFESTVVAIRVIDNENGTIISEVNMGSEPEITTVSADVTGKNSIRISVTLVSGGNGFVNLGYTFIKDAYLEPAEIPEEENSQVDGNAEEGADNS